MALLKWISLSYFGVLFEQVLVSAGNFLTIAICAHMLSLGEQGKVMYAISLYIGLVVLNVALYHYGAALIAPEFEDKRLYWVLLSRINALISFSFSLIIAFAFYFLGPAFGWHMNTVEALVLFVYLFFQQLVDFDRRSKFIFRSYREAIVNSASVYPLRISLLLLMHPDSFLSAGAILIVSSLIPVAFAMTRVMEKIRLNQGIEPVKEILKRHFSFSVPFILNAPLGWLCFYLPIYALGAIVGIEASAVLASIRGLTNFANVFMESLETVVPKIFSERFVKGGKDDLRRITKRILYFGIVFWFFGAIMFSFFGRQIIGIVLGSRYLVYAKLLILLWSGVGLFFIVRVIGIYIRSKRVIYNELAGSIAGILGLITTGIPLIKAYGIYGAGLAFLILPVFLFIGQQTANFIYKRRRM